MAALGTLCLMPFLLLLPGWSRGPAAGALVASAVWMVALQTVLATGTAATMMGDTAEQYTASELRKLRRRGWRVVNRIVLRGYGDIDHVAVGPGGLVVFETKWIANSTGGRASLQRRVGDAVGQINRNAIWLYRMFPNDVPPECFMTAVVVWGPDAASWGEPRSVDGTIVVAGQDLREWLADRPSDCLPRATIEKVSSAIDDHVRRRDANDLALEGPRPQGLGELSARALGIVCTALLAVVAVAQVAVLAPHAEVAIPAGVLLTTGGFAVRRSRALALFALSWIIGCAFATTLLAALFLYSAPGH